MDKNVWVKCQSCGEEYIVEKDFCKQTDIEGKCDK